MSRTAAPRIRTSGDELVPVVMVRLVFAMILLSLAITGFAVWSGRPLEATPPESAVVSERVLFLSGDLSGAARVLDATGTVIADLGPQEGGFIAGIERVLVRERTKARVAIDGPIRLIRTENGRLAITDPSTGWRADLMGFGADNAATFARLLP
ncbi:photosynthetic complex assembly protein PuhC [Litorisediminicola beolgyonensis]|uniref:Photosynthetic complex assembly protein PuhC n=1 Tax=Litorisediminicola beolgyonensis TaxID=1173614 RepID=A0ABW3ZGA7_9RHOB